MSSISLHRAGLVPHAGSAPRSLGRQFALCVGASLLVAISAHISLPMPYTPVPTTMQTFAVVLVGMLLGPVSGFFALALYLAEGATGLPVFSPQGLGGIAQLHGPTAGYLFAYPVAAAIAGQALRLTRRVLPLFPAALTSGAVALVPVFGLGALWLARWMHLSGPQSIHLGVSPFLFAELVKLSAAAAAASSLIRARRS